MSKTEFKQPVDEIFDREWMKTTFVLSDEETRLSRGGFQKYMRKNRFMTSADFKFTSTAPGMNLSVNPKPQFTRYADIRSSGRIKSRDSENMSLYTRSHKTGLGMGNFYSEAFDDTAQRIFLRFGVPQHKFLALWIAEAFDVKRAMLYNTGSISSSLLNLVDITTKIFRIASAPLLGVAAFIYNAARTNSRYITLKPTMYLYWATVEDLLNKLVVRRSLAPYLYKDYDFKVGEATNNEPQIKESFIKELNQQIPDIVDTNGRISVFGLALKAQKIFNRLMYEDNQKFEKDLKVAVPDINETNIEDQYINRPFSADGTVDLSNYLVNDSGEITFMDKLFLKAYNIMIGEESNDELIKQNNEELPTTQAFELTQRDENGNLIDTSNLEYNDPYSPRGDILKLYEQKINKSQFFKFKEYILAELSEGAAFAVFNVKATGSVSESFSNSMKDHPIGSIFNDLSNRLRTSALTESIKAAKEIPYVGDIVSTVLDAGAIVVKNATFGLVNPLLALAYGVNVEVPKIWESSSADLPRGNYSIRLISPYGNAYSQLFNMYLPLAMILAGSLPRSTGSSSYSAPFMCQLFDRGRVNMSLGVIDSVTVTRGVSNLTFTKNGHANAIDLDISITNLDPIISLDISSEGVISGAINTTFSPLALDTPLTDYVNTITGLDVYHQIYRVPKYRLGLIEKQFKYSLLLDPAAQGAFVTNSIIPGAGLIRDFLGNNTRAISQTNAQQFTPTPTPR